jgi:hypothetical protein
MQEQGIVQSLECLLVVLPRKEGQIQGINHAVQVSFRPCRFRGDTIDSWTKKKGFVGRWRRRAFAHRSKHVGTDEIGARRRTVETKVRRSHH